MHEKVFNKNNFEKRPRERGKKLNLTQRTIRVKI